MSGVCRYLQHEELVYSDLPLLQTSRVNTFGVIYEFPCASTIRDADDRVAETDFLARDENEM